MYALTSALAVYRVTKACSAGNLSSACGCDNSKNGQLTIGGWRWGSCTDNVSYGISFAQNFLDARDIEKTGSNNRDDIMMSLTHFHNNAVGRRVSH